MPGQEFKCKCGVRQGDPLLPLLFVLAADILQSLINRAWADGHLTLPIEQPASEDFPVIQYADDTILVLPAQNSQLLIIHQILESYAKATGLKINYHKSQLIPVNVAADRAQELADVLGCTVGSMPFTYLGLPMGITRPTMQELMPLVDGVERRLSSMAIWLTYGSRVNLINSTLSSLLSFAMCVLKIPEKLLKCFDHARRHCLWRKVRDRDVHTHSLTSWDMVCRPKNRGGLGIIDL